MNSKLDSLTQKLKEIFQIDKQELDFGIYRILNTRSEQIAYFLENTLPQKVREKLKGNEEQENAVYNHLLTFFARYYDNGDFISQRRYKGETYAIPYNGEEVVLHWANKDQYYTKSGENFSHYRFALEDGRKVHFRLIEADTAKDNRKEEDKNRLFVLAEPRMQIGFDEENNELERQIEPFSVNEQGELEIRFEYKAMPKSAKQPELIKQAVENFRFSAFTEQWILLLSPASTEKNKDRTLFEKHLSDYTTKNTADYFIHKNLGEFLSRELDFYIKNEVMNLDNLQNAEDFADIERNLSLIQTLRSVAKDLIAFLAQLENFQKRLWLKKKFVANCHYLITLDKLLPALKDQKSAVENLLNQVLNNAKQRENWLHLFGKSVTPPPPRILMIF
ncbi:hypothetical protein THUN1656_16570 [Rodentibacter abscessus]|uniref:restriction endonuclease subunit M n=1 Tax=Rodentibacter abscessus TaxID=3381777 RepID=UPI003CCCE089